MVCINEQFNKDFSKRVLVIPQMLLRWVNLWPQRRNRVTKSVFCIMLLLMAVLEMGQLIYFALNIQDITTMASTMSTISTTFQAICKASLLFLHHKRLNGIISKIENDFWPSNCLGLEVENTLSFNSRLAISSMMAMLCSAVVFATGFLTAPLREASRNLPFLSWYPFDYSASPSYEILYALQSLLNVCYIVISICGHDYLFLAVCTNCVAQYKMLKQAMAKIGTLEGAKLNLKLKMLEVEKTCKYRDSEGFHEKELLVRCVEHHNKLIRIYDDIEVVFSASNFVQLLCSVSAICVSSFLIVMTGKAQIVHLTSYCLGHVLQLFLFCAPANELAYQSQSLTTYAFSSAWYKKKHLKFKKDLIMVLLLSQKRKKISALGIVDLNYATFITVLRLSFSFYTLLSSIVEK